MIFITGFTVESNAQDKMDLYSDARMQELNLEKPSSELLKQQVTLQYDQVSIEKLLAYLEREQGIQFSYNKEILAGNPRVTVDLEEVSLDEALNTIFKNIAVQYYAFAGGYIVLRERSFNEVVQIETVSGTVTDAESGETLPGVNVMVKGTTTGTSTGTEGTYELNAPSLQDTLVFSFIGYQTQEVPISGRTTIDVSLQSEAIAGEELVVVGYGTQRKSNLTGSVQSVELGDAVNTPVTNSSQLMYGKFSGVQMTQNAGLPGSDNSSILIRGVGTFGNSTPLIVIDGMQFDGLSEFNRLAPSDIKNITVLKDAAAGAIYGARGANGVIVVTTKKGSKSEVEVAYNNYFGIQQPTVKPDYLSAIDYARLINERLVNISNDPSATRYSDQQLQQIQNGSKSAPFAQTNWQDILLKNAFIQNHNLSFSWGNEKTTYRISAGYLDQGSVLEGKFGYDRLTLRSNIHSELSDWLTIGNNLNGAYEINKGPNGGASGAGAVMNFFNFPPTIPVRYSNGNYGVTDGTFYEPNGTTKGRNPVFLANHGNFQSNRTNINNRLNIEIKPIKGLSIESAITANLSFLENSDWNPTFEERDWNNDLLEVSGFNSLSNGSRNHYRWLWDNTITYNNSFGSGHNITILTGHSSLSNIVDGFNGSLENFPSESLQEFNAGGVSNPSVAGGKVKKSLQSFFGRVNYNYQNRYLFEANFRRDGSSKFGSGNRYASFPSFSAGWIISQESFMESVLNTLSMNYLKVRGSWGRTGNNRIGNYIFDQTYNSNLNYVLGDDTVVSAAAITSLANTNIKWETTEQYDIGLEMGFFQDRLNIETDYFNRRSYDVLYTNFPVPATLGVNSIAARNSAEVLNKGFEFNINFRNQSKDRFSYNIGLNFTKMAPNEVVSLGDGVRTIGQRNIVAEGEPFRAYYGYKVIGIFQSDEEANKAPTQLGLEATGAGDLRFADISGPEGVPDDVVDEFDRTVIGSPYPEWMYGFNANISYSGFDLSLSLQGVYNIDRLIMDEATRGFGNTFGNIYSYWKDRWTPENKDTDLYALGGGGHVNNVQATSSFYVQDASYLRLKNIEFGYSIPKTLIGQIGYQKFRLFVSGQNLFTITEMENIDPERNAGNTRTRNVPIYKVITAGIDISF